MTSPRDWWRRAAALVKDKRSLCMTRVARGRRQWPGGGPWSSELEVAVIRATSHDEQAVDYKSAERVFARARAAPSFVDPLMWALARRAARTRCWAVALKSLLLAHGLLLCPQPSSSIITAGPLPFDLSDFRDRSPDALGFSAFVRAYFHFLDYRSLLLHDTDDDLIRVERLQSLLELLMQIRPYANGMSVKLVLEAMDCALIEIFEVYSGICNGIACFLVSILGSSSTHQPKLTRGTEEEEEEEEDEEKKRRGEMGVRILRRAAEQSTRLTSYFEVCRALGVLNAKEFPPVERIPEEDILDLERLVLGGTAGNHETQNKEEVGGVEREEEGDKVLHGLASTVVTEDWVVFEDEPRTKEKGCFGNEFGHPGKNPFVDSPQRTPNVLWELRVHHQPPKGGGGRGALSEQ